MNIVFICSSLQPGKDGVGDYIRRLSCELQSLGHKASIVALNDKFITTAANEVQDEIEVLRIPSVLGKPQKSSLLKSFISLKKPAFLSLQFVPFGYNNKGLPFSLAPALAAASANIPWHVMIHELWVGMESEAAPKMRLLGFLQKHLIRSILSALKPSVVHTQTHLYVKQLEKLGVHAYHLPLFSNIPVLEKAAGSLALAGNKIHAGSALTMVLFGVIHSNTPVEIFAAEVGAFAKKHQVDIRLQLLGKSGESERNRWKQSFTSSGMEVELLGEQTPERISAILGRASIGIATTAYAVIEKSGTVAALRAHGLPVLCVCDSWTPVNIKDLAPPQAVLEYKQGNFESLILGKIDYPQSLSAKETAERLVSDLAR